MISAGVRPCVSVASTRIVPAIVAPIIGIRSRSPAMTPITTGYGVPRIQAETP